MNAHINSAGHVIVDGKYTDLMVRAESGYEIRRREVANAMPVAERLSHLIGKRVVLEPKKDSQITEADFLKAVDDAARCIWNAAMTAEDFNRWLAEMKAAGQARNIQEAGALIGRKPDMMTKYRQHGADKTVGLACAAALAGLAPYGAANDE